MSNCPICGSRMMRFENPDREICPSPQKHTAMRKLGENSSKVKAQRRREAEKKKGKK